MTALSIGIPSKSYDAATVSVGNGTVYALLGVSNLVTWESSFSSSPSAISLLIQTSLDNSTWSTVHTSTSTTGESRIFNTSALFIRARIASATGGSGITVNIVAKVGDYLAFPIEPANTVLAGPVSGSDAFPTFRALVAADIPGLTGYLPLTGGTLTGNLLFTDNLYDIGASGATRPRTGYFGTSVVTPILYGGVNANDDITIHGTSNATKTTSYVLLQPTSGNVGIGVSAPSNTLTLVSTGILGWDNGSGTADVLLQRDASNISALRNSTTAQTFRWYASYTDASNYTRGSLTATTGTPGAVTLAAQSSGTGSTNINIVLTPKGTGVTQVSTAFQMGNQAFSGAQTYSYTIDGDLWQAYYDATDGFRRYMDYVCASADRAGTMRFLTQTAGNTNPIERMRIDQTSGAVWITNLSVGVTSTDGLLITNTTVATVGAQKWSPRLHFTGNGWKTDSTAGSQICDWIQELQPVQGAANPTSNLVFSSQINVGGYTAQLLLTSNGLMAFAGITSSFPALKRSTTILQGRLADDSAYCSLQGKLTTDTNATTGLVAGVLAATTNASIVVYDASGQAYRVPCII